MATNNTNTTKKSSAKKDSTRAELEAKIAKLEALLALKESESKKETEETAQASSVSQSTTTSQTMPFTFTIPNTDVTVVYCSDSLGFAKISNMELNFNRYGEEFTLSRNQFDELVGKYRSWFDSGILTVSYKNVDIAAAKGVKTDKEVYLDVKKLESIGKMTTTQLEELWNSVNMPSHRLSIVSYYKRKFIEGDADFMNREKVDLMNRLTNGGFTREQDELSGRYKINPTEM